MNPYDVLGVASSATAGEIEAAYRRLAAEQHAESRWQQILAAYLVLGHPESRARFDNGDLRFSADGWRKPAMIPPAPAPATHTAGKPDVVTDLFAAVDFATEMGKPAAERDKAKVREGFVGAVRLAGSLADLLLGEDKPEKPPAAGPSPGPKGKR
jgi:DnaJ-class molecular chaperone